jgi:hypothetical protein
VAGRRTGHELFGHVNGAGSGSQRNMVSVAGTEATVVAKPSA